MLEAVNSVLQSAPLIRATAEQVSALESFAANPDRTQKVAVAPYISPYIHMDVNFDKAVLQIRDSNTGDVLHQFPSETKLQAGIYETARREAAQDEAIAQSSSAGKRSSAPANNAAAGTSGSYAASNYVAAQEEVSRAASSAAASAPQPQQIAAFQAAARTGNSNAGSVTLFA